MNQRCASIYKKSVNFYATSYFISIYLSVKKVKSSRSGTKTIVYLHIILHIHMQCLMLAELENGDRTLLY